MRVTEIATAGIKDYISSRLEAGLSNASINRELAALKRMFNLGLKCTPSKVRQVPYIPMLKESNVRKGFFEHEEFLALREALPDYLRPVVTFAYHIGWRKKEIVKLTWDRTDLKQGIIRLEPGETKNSEGRTVYLNEELLELLRTLQAARRLGCPYVFHCQGRKIGDIRKSWEPAFMQIGHGAIYRCKDCGHQMEFTRKVRGKDFLCTQCKSKDLKWEGKIFHDFRRTAVRNMVRAGIPERVAMQISGHKTRSVFDRYNIVSQTDLKEAAKKQEIFLRSVENGYNLVTMDKKMPLKPEILRGKSLNLLVGHTGIEPVTY
jgi:integrase